MPRSCPKFEVIQASSREELPIHGDVGKLADELSRTAVRPGVKETGFVDR